MANALVDIETLRRALRELGYTEYLDEQSSLLVHRILLDLNQLSTQYTNLVTENDELANHLHGGAIKNKSRSEGSSLLDSSFLSSLGMGVADGVVLDDSFMLHAVEQARNRIDGLTAENKKLTEQNTQLQADRDKFSAEVQRLQLGSQELSQLLHTKSTHLESAQRDLDQMTRTLTSGLTHQLNLLIRTSASLLPLELQQAYLAKMGDNAELQLACLQEIINRLGKEQHSSSLLLKETQATLEKLRREHDASEDAMAKMRGGIAQYQSQIAELNTRMQQRDFEQTLQSDIAAQIKTMHGINEALREKVNILEKLKIESASNSNGEMAQFTVQALLESLSAELNTEVCFSSHLNQLIEKLNQKRIEQDGELADAHSKLREAESRLSLAEGEKIELKSRLEKAQNELLSRDGAVSTNSEVVVNLKQAVASKQARIEEQKRYCSELKAALDQCQASMAAMRRNEEVIRQHAQGQDEEIRKLRALNEQISSQKHKSLEYYQNLESELTLLKKGSREKNEENLRLTAELKAAVTAQEKALMSLHAAKEGVSDLEEALQAKRKEKDMLMTTYCRVIKDNERLHADFQKLQEEQMAARIGGNQNGNTLKAFQTKSHIQAQDIDRLRAQLATQDAKVLDLESRLEEAGKVKRRLEEEIIDKNKEIGHLKNVIDSLERSKRDLAAQMARFGQQASELRNHLRTAEAEKSDLQDRLRNITVDNPSFRTIQNQISTLTTELETVRSQLGLLEKEKKLLNQQIQIERNRSDKIDQMLSEERSKRMEKESEIKGLEVTRNRLKEQLERINREHERGLNSIKKQMKALHEDSEYATPSRTQPKLRSDSSDAANNLFKSRWSVARQRTRDRVPDSKYEDDEVDVKFGSGNRRLSPYFPEHNGTISPSPPESPKEYDSTERLYLQNMNLKRHLQDIRREMRDNITSPQRSAVLEELESSLTGLTASEESSGPTSEEIIQNNAEIRKRLEKENKILFKIVDKVRSELLKAGIDSPPSLPSNPLT